MLTINQPTDRCSSSHRFPSDSYDFGGPKDRWWPSSGKLWLNYQVWRSPYANFHLFPSCIQLFQIGAALSDHRTRSNSAVQSLSGAVASTSHDPTLDRATTRRFRKKLDLPVLMKPGSQLYCSWRFKRTIFANWKCSELSFGKAGARGDIRHSPRAATNRFTSPIDLLILTITLTMNLSG